ncbi:hypothetical protein NCU16563 [Neurospora crassa OR74A]|uniref:Uncharacterized protein n=1 Tax=Neurospora crassa (strain ATCC 24698 / 74-OR23-1A / CBS 708.71 / DSM 1257 / FGSC 987) TaxID=367110 RepID=V5IR45_NEUCR|nr:hypothetical protein NCU16563 [Neurospora crassa OR74A]ESA43656.1 hypothetical protein NCU16563 [Neurospora crassa OR74A]|eukprot:XP_011393701.1 hypothetical protein NCU16563 [Neurospora crassa OR74A]
MLPNAVPQSRWRLSGRKTYKWVSAPAHAIEERDRRVQRARQTGREKILPSISVCSHAAPAHHTSAVIQARQAEDPKDEMRDVIVCSHVFALPSSLHRACVANAKPHESVPERTSG